MADDREDIDAVSGGRVRWLTYDEAGRILGIDPDSVNRRARRQGWRRQPGNDGKARVAVPLDLLLVPSRDSKPAGVTIPQDTPGDIPGDNNGYVPADIYQIIKALEGETEVLREVLAREQGRADHAVARAEAATKDAGNAREERARLQGELEAVRLALTAVQEQRAVAQAEVTRIQVERGQAEERAQALQAELRSWTAGGPIARALRALLFRPQR